MIVSEYSKALKRMILEDVILRSKKEPNTKQVRMLNKDVNYLKIVRKLITLILNQKINIITLRVPTKGTPYIIIPKEKYKILKNKHSKNIKIWERYVRINSKNKNKW